MKVKTVVLGCLIVAVVLFVVHEFSLAQPMLDSPASKIGLISVSRVMRDCRATVAFGVKAKAEDDELIKNQDALKVEIQTLTKAAQAFVRGTSDYMAQYRLLVQKQAELKALEEYLREKRVTSQRAWAEKLYQEILRITKEVGARRGLNLVLQRSEPEFPTQNADQLMMAISTHKVLYGGGCVDVTDEVIAELDKIESTLLQ